MGDRPSARSTSIDTGSRQAHDKFARPTRGNRVHTIDRIILVVVGALFGAGLTLFIAYDWMSRTGVVLCMLVVAIALPYSAIRSGQTSTAASADS